MAIGLQRHGVKIRVSQLWYQQRRDLLNAFSREDAGSGEREGRVALPAPGGGQARTGTVGTGSMAAQNAQPAGTLHSSLVFLGLTPSTAIFVML